MTADVLICVRLFIKWTKRLPFGAQWLPNKESNYGHSLEFSEMFKRPNGWLTTYQLTPRRI